MSRPASLPFVSRPALESLLPYEDAVSELRRAFGRARGEGPERARVAVPGGELLLMPAFGDEGVAVKLVTLPAREPDHGQPRVQGVFVLFSAGRLAPELVVDGAALTERRTAAVSAMATDALARAGSSRLVVFGAGRQAQAHIEAVAAVRPIEWVGVVGRRPEPARRLVARLRETGLQTDTVSALAVGEADIVCTCTPSTEALFDDRWLAAGAHVNAIGAYRDTMRELPAATLARALLVVESRAAALAEAGDIIQAIAEGAIEAGHVAGDLTDLVRGDIGRADAEQVTVFKSVGLADEDLVLGAFVARRLAAGDGRAEPGSGRRPV